jgi:hypothetical protein
MDYSRLKPGLHLLAVVLLIHLILGVYAFLSGGSFLFGFTAVERYLYNYDSDLYFNPTGSIEGNPSLLCLQSCDECNLFCYPLGRINASCGPCAISTLKNGVIVNENASFRAVVLGEMLLENVSYRCYTDGNATCGFEQSSTSGLNILYQINP